MAGTRGLRVNERIRVRGDVRVVDENGGQLGLMPAFEALALARERDLDLVEIAANAVPPVCKIIDYGKYRFEMEKKLRENRKNQKISKLKEIRMQPKIADGDIEFKAKHIREFLEDGSRVKVTIRFRGRELAHTELGRDVLLEILRRLEGCFVVEKQPMMEGRTMSMMLAPKGKK